MSDGVTAQRQAAQRWEQLVDQATPEDQAWMSEFVQLLRAQAAEMGAIEGEADSEAQSALVKAFIAKWKRHES